MRTPQKLANNFAFAFNPDNILLLGGMLRKEEAYVPTGSTKVFELNDQVYVLKTTKKKMVWKDLKPLPFKKKLCQVVYNNHGKFFCFVLESNKELPQLFVYDIRKIFAQFCKYAEHAENVREAVAEVKHLQTQTVEEASKQDLGEGATQLQELEFN